MKGLVILPLLFLVGCAAMNPWASHPVSELGKDVNIVAARIQTLQAEVAASHMLSPPRKENLGKTLDIAKAEAGEALDLLTMAGTADPNVEKIKTLIKSSNYRCDAVRAVLDNN